MRAPSKRLVSSLALALLGGLLAIPRSAHAYPLLPSIPTAEGTGTIFPSLVVSGDARTFIPLLYGAVGLSERFDIFAGASGVFGRSPASASFGMVDVAPRFLVTPQLALSPRILYTPGHSLALSPELHTTLMLGSLMLTANAGIRPTLGLHGEGLTSTTAFAYVAGSYFVSRQLWFVLEADPALTFVRGTETTESSRLTNVVMVSGVGFALDPEMSHVFEMAALITVPTSSASSFHYASSVTYAMFYATSFKLWEK
jgi:hypothetical protein